MYTSQRSHQNLILELDVYKLTNFGLNWTNYPILGILKRSWRDKRNEPTPGPTGCTGPALQAKERAPAV